MLEVRSLTSGYGSFEVLHGVSLSVPDNGIVALLGHNGAGKSTLLKSIVGELPLWSGQVLFKDQPWIAGGSAATARRGIRYVPQEGNTFPALSVSDNLKLGAYAVNPGRAALEHSMEQ